MSAVSMREAKTKSVTNVLRSLFWRTTSRIGYWLVGCANARDFNASAFSDDSIGDVLHRALRFRTGKLRLSDAFLICGIEAGRATQDQIERFGRAIRKLGWERKRRRFDGAIEYAYVKGNAREREVQLVVEYDPHTRSVRIKTATN